MAGAREGGSHGARGRDLGTAAAPRRRHAPFRSTAAGPPRRWPPPLPHALVLIPPPPSSDDSQLLISHSAGAEEGGGSKGEARAWLRRRKGRRGFVGRVRLRRRKGRRGSSVAGSARLSEWVKLGEVSWAGRC